MVPTPSSDPSHLALLHQIYASGKPSPSLEGLQPGRVSHPIEKRRFRSAGKRVSSITCRWHTIANQVLAPQGDHRSFACYRLNCALKK